MLTLICNYADAEYEEYAALAPRGKLDLILDQEHEGVDIHLGKIADCILKWEAKLAPALGLTPAEISDILDSKKHPAVQRCVRGTVHLLLKWCLVLTCVSVQEGSAAGVEEEERCGCHLWKSTESVFEE